MRRQRPKEPERDASKAAEPASVRTSAEPTRTGREIPDLISSGNEESLRDLIHNFAFDETQVCLLLERKDLSSSLLEEIAKRKDWRGSYRVRLGLAAHPHTPRLVAMRLLRELHLMDLVRISLLATSSMELRRLADERILNQLPQLPLGQKLTLARRGSTRIAAGLVALGPEQVARVALDNPFLTEAQLLKVLSRESLAARVVATVARHDKWSRLVNVRVALLRHRHAPLTNAAALADGLPKGDIESLLQLSNLKEEVRNSLVEEMQRRGF